MVKSDFGITRFALIVWYLWERIIDRET